MKRRSKWAKRCSVCGKVIASHNKSGLCWKHSPIEAARKRREIPGMREKMNKYNKEYRQQPEVKKKIREYYQKNREKIIKARKENYQKNKEKRKEYAREYRKKNKEEISKKQKEYYKKNREKIINKIREDRKKKKK